VLDNKYPGKSLIQAFCCVVSLFFVFRLALRARPNTAQLVKILSGTTQQNVQIQIVPNEGYCLLIPRSTKMANWLRFYFTQVFYILEAFLIERIIPLALVGYEMVIANLTRRLSQRWL